MQALPTKAEAEGLADGLWIPGTAACGGGRLQSGVRSGFRLGSGLRLRAELSDRGKAAPGCAKQGGVVAVRTEYPRSCGMGRRAASEGRKTERVKATGTTKKPTVA